MRNWKDDKGLGPWDFEEQPDKWGYLNNPRWQLSSQKPESYSSSDIAEPQVWTPPDEVRRSNGEKHIPCGHWHKRSLVNYVPRVYVGDRLDQISIFSLTGVLYKRFGSNGSGEGQFGGYSGVCDIFIYNDEIYATDPGNFRVQVFDLEGNFLRKWGTSTDGTFYNDGNPHLGGICVHGGIVYTSENDGGGGLGGVIKRFSLAGVFIDKWYPYDGGGGALLGIACQGAEAFAVRAVRVAVHRISGGSYLRTWTAPYFRSFQYPTFYEDEFWIVRGDNVIEKETFSGDIISSFSVPSNNDIAFYDDEIFFNSNVADTIQVYSLSGTLLREWAVHSVVNSYTIRCISVH